VSRQLSQAARRAVFAQETEEVFTLLATISHDELAEPIRVANDVVPEDANGARLIPSRGANFVCYPFDVDLPADDGESISQVTITIDNVDREIIQKLRAIHSPCAVRLEVVLTSSPDIVEAGPFEMTLKQVEYDALVISGTLAFEDFLTQAFPADTYNPADYPGVH